ncbi:MAG: hypothetical protein PHN82_04170 [bacterium]|nr:hypothetical protein [bacterium]
MLAIPKRALAALLPLLLAAGVCHGQNLLKIHHLNVNWGDASLIEFPDGTTWLIDMGYSDSDGYKVYSYIYDLGYTGSLNYITASHFHSDHVGGVDMVIGSGLLTYTAAAYQHIGPQVGGDSGYTTTWRNRTNGSWGPAATSPTAGQTWNFGGVEVQCIAVGDTNNSRTRLVDGTYVSLGSDENSYSLGFRISWNGFDYYTAGDLTSNAEDVLGPKIASHNFDVIKVSHHGSTSSTSASFLNQMKPEVAVISVGSSNPYGHPASSTLSNLVNAGVSWIYVTARGSSSPNPVSKMTYCEDNIVVTYNNVTNQYTVVGGPRNDTYAADEGTGEPTATPTPPGPTATPTITPTPTQTPSSENLLQNPGFEEGGTPPASWAKSGGTFDTSSDRARSGSYSGKYTDDNTTLSYAHQVVVGVTGGAQYDCSGWIYDNTSAAYGYFSVYWYAPSDGSGPNIGSEQFGADSENSSSWQYREGTVTAPSGAGSARFRCNIKATSAPATIYFDDVRMAPHVAGPSPTPTRTPTRTPTPTVTPTPTPTPTPYPDLLFSDDFPSSVIDTEKWPTNVGPATSVMDGDHPGYSLNLNGISAGGDRIESRTIDLSGQAGATLGYWWARAGSGDSPETGDDLIIEYWNEYWNSSGTWIELGRHLGSGPDMVEYEFASLELPAGAPHAAFQFRFRSIGRNHVRDRDDWFVDDVEVRGASTLSPTATPTPTITPTPVPADFPLKLSFQPAETDPVDGYMPDDGSDYGPRGPHEYGWQQ